MGQLDVPGDADDYEDYVDFTPRGWPWVDPLKDQQAAQMGIQNKTTTLTESLANQGKDLIDVLEERRAAQLFTLRLLKIFARPHRRFCRLSVTGPGSTW